MSLQAIRRIHDVTATMLAGPPDEHGRPPWPEQVQALRDAIAEWSREAIATPETGADRSFYLADANGTVYLAKLVIGDRPYAPVYTLTEHESEAE